MRESLSRMKLIPIILPAITMAMMLCSGCGQVQRVELPFLHAEDEEWNRWLDAPVTFIPEDNAKWSVYEGRREWPLMLSVRRFVAENGDASPAVTDSAIHVGEGIDTTSTWFGLTSTNVTRRQALELMASQCDLVMSFGKLDWSNADPPIVVTNALLIEKKPYP